MVPWTGHPHGKGMVRGRVYSVNVRYEVRQITYESLDPQRNCLGTG
jgi:hypothetical protein